MVVGQFEYSLPKKSEDRVGKFICVRGGRELNTENLQKSLTKDM